MYSHIKINLLRLSLAPGGRCLTNEKIEIHLLNNIFSNSIQYIIITS